MKPDRSAEDNEFMESLMEVIRDEHSFLEEIGRL